MLKINFKCAFYLLFICCATNVCANTNGNQNSITTPQQGERGVLEKQKSERAEFYANKSYIPKSFITKPYVFKSLKGNKVYIPGDLPQDEVVIMIVGFAKESKEPMSMWHQALLGSTSNVKEGDAEATRPYTLYRVSMLSGVPGFLRGFIVKQIKKGIKPNERDHYLIVSKNADFWKQLTEYDKDAHTYVVALKRNLTLTENATHEVDIIWLERGAYTAEGLDRIYQALSNN